MANVLVQGLAKSLKYQQGNEYASV